MRNRKKVMIAIAVLIAIIASCRIYFIRMYAGGLVLWNANEAYFFIQVGHEGLHVSYLRYPLAFVLEYLGAPELSDDNRTSLVVIQVAASGVEHHVLKLADRLVGGGGATDPGKFTALEGRIYATCVPFPNICRWAGDHFEPVTPDEQQRLGGYSRLTVGDIDEDENGWARREFGTMSGYGPAPRDSRFTIDVGDKLRLSISSLAENGTRHGAVSIDLIRPGHANERIWDLDVLPRRVSRTEYRHAFQGPA
jgi:hypothetical protein